MKGTPFIGYLLLSIMAIAFIILFILIIRLVVSVFTENEGDITNWCNDKLIYYRSYLQVQYDKLMERQPFYYISETLWKIKDYDRLEHDYSCALMYATNGSMSKTNYSISDVECEIENAIQLHCYEHEQEVLERMQRSNEIINN